MKPRRRLDAQNRTATSPELSRRLTKVQRGLARRRNSGNRVRLEAMLVFDRYNTFYLTGLHCSHSFLFITPREAILVVDGRYIESARSVVHHLEVRLMRHAREAFGRIGREFQPRTVGFEASTPWGALNEWRQFLPDVEWSECGELILKQRLIKSAAEVKLIEKSARLTDRIFEQLCAAIGPGMTEYDVRNLIRAEADHLGAEGLSFDCIVASGATSSRPHYFPQPRPLEAGDLLLVDMGVILGSYCSDMTRVVGLGRKPRPRLRRAYDVVLEAEQAAIDAIAPGVPCAELDRIARERIKARRLGRYFVHGLGHGVGLEIHEAPTLNNRSREVLRAGMVITIEPGVYLPDQGGVRIEDLVVVTRNGHRVLSHSPKTWRLLPFEA